MPLCRRANVRNHYHHLFLLSQHSRTLINFLQTAALHTDVSSQTGGRMTNEAIIIIICVVVIVFLVAFLIICCLLCSWGKKKQNKYDVNEANGDANPKKLLDTEVWEKSCLRGTAKTYNGGQPHSRELFRVRKPRSSSAQWKFVLARSWSSSPLFNRDSAWAGEGWG